MSVNLPPSVVTEANHLRVQIQYGETKTKHKTRKRAEMITIITMNDPESDHFLSLSVTHSIMLSKRVEVVAFAEKRADDSLV